MIVFSIKFMKRKFRIDLWRLLKVKSEGEVHGIIQERIQWQLAPKFSDTLTLYQPGGGQILPTIAQVEPKFPP